MDMTSTIVGILIVVILCHVAQRKESKWSVALPRMEYVVMKLIVVEPKVTSVVLMKRKRLLLAVVRLIPDLVALMGVVLQTLPFVVHPLVVAVP